MKFLVVGDAHIRPQDLDEGKRLISFCQETGLKYKVDAIVFMGDQTHYHDLTHNSVLSFWKESFQILSWNFKVIVLVGNHDFENGRKEHSMAYFKEMDNVSVVDSPVIFDNKLFLPFMKNDKFIEVCNEFKEIGILFCHQGFDGAKYENGAYEPNGVDPELIPQTLVIGGHIHEQQYFGKIALIGSPRWLISSDANADRCIHIWEFDDKTWTSHISVSTDVVCSKILEFDDNEDSPLEFGLFDFGFNPRVSINVYGSIEYIKARSSHWNSKGFRVRTFPKKNTVKVKESDGVVNSFNVFLEKYTPPNGTSKQRLMELVKEKKLWIRE